MSAKAETAPKVSSGTPFRLAAGGMLQRKCACGVSAGLTGSCSDCDKKKLLGKSLQHKLAISEPGDVYEQEADRVAEQVMRMSPADVSRKQNNRGTQPLVQRRASGGATGLTEAPPIVHEVLNSPGQPLDASTRAFFEPRFGHDFSQVRVHTDSKAGDSAKDVNATAYTVGEHVVFSSGKHQPFSLMGSRLLAHELTHIVQQDQEKGMSRGNIIQRSPDIGEITEEDAKSCSPLYLQKLCVYIIGGFNGDRSGVETDEQMKSYNNDCRKESGYTGPDVSLSGAEKAALHSPRCARGNAENARARQIAARISEALNRSVKYMPGGIGDQLVKIVNDPVFRGSLALAVGIYLALWLAPEPVFTKIAAAATTLAILATGVFSVSTIINLAEIWGDLEKEAAAAENDQQIEEAAKRFGTRMGAVEADLLVFLASLLVGGKLPGPKSTPPPGPTLANAEASLASAESGAVVIRGNFGNARMAPRGAAVPDNGLPGPSIRGNNALKIEYSPAAKPQPKVTPELKPMPAANDNAVPYTKPAVAKSAVSGQGVQPTPMTPVVPSLGSKADEKEKCAFPTGLSPKDPIELIWYKPRVDDYYPRQIQIQNHSYNRDEQGTLPQGELIGVVEDYWPRKDKLVQLIPEVRGPNASRFREVLANYGFDWGGIGGGSNRRWLQADHVQDLQWARPDGYALDVFSNLWPMDGAANMSAGSRQNNLQVVRFCETQQGPPVEMPIVDMKRLGRAGRPYFGRFFKIVRIER